MAKLKLKPERKTEGSPSSSFLPQPVKLKKIEQPEELLKIMKAERKKKKISQKELSVFANISLTSIGEIERAEVDVKLSHLLKILKLCGVSLYAKIQE